MEFSILPIFKAMLFGWIIPFTIFTALSFLSKGKKAFSWTKELKNSARTNLTLYLTNFVLLTLVFQNQNILSGSWERLGLPTLDASIWEHIPVWGVVCVIIVANDFINYWNHRLMHSSVLWDMHSVHHSDQNMNFTTAYRVHYLEPLFMKFTFIIGASWLGLPDVAVVLPFVLIGLHNSYVHVDIDWGHGPFAKVIASPRYHRWHHADHPEAINKNFANIFPIWDVVFKTYYCPGKCEEPLGFEGAENQNFGAMLIAPFNPILRLANRYLKNGKSSTISSTAS